MAGRPSEFSQDIADAICGRLAEGESLRAICDDEAMPDKSTVFRWLGRDAEFRDQYARAREAQADALFDDILSIADDGRNDWMERKNKDDQNLGWVENGEALRRSALRVDARKWMAGKLKPKKYGDKLELENNHNLSDPMKALFERIATGGNKLVRSMDLPENAVSSTGGEQDFARDGQ